jgi:hypothetical protein
MTGEERREGVSGEPPDDYFSTVAEVVEAAKKVKEAQRLEGEASELHMRRFQETKDAEKELNDALEKLGKIGARNM